VKVCGITNAADAAAAVEAGADMLGFNFYARSPRCITPEAAAAIIERLPRRVLAVGIFVDADADTIRATIATARIALLQLHGDERPEFCRSFRVPAMKALRIQSFLDLAAAAAPDSDGWLLADTADPTRHGGTGRSLPIEPVPRELARRLSVARGLSPDSVTDLDRRVRPLGVDVCSGVECAPGVKDHTLVRRFVINAKTA
jgi:phosphoribosylanthranilate isomerase